MSALDAIARSGRALPLTRCLLILALTAAPVAARAQEADGVAAEGAERGRAALEPHSSGRPRLGVARTGGAAVRDELEAEGLIPEGVRDDVEASLDRDALVEPERVDPGDLDDAEVASLPVGGSRSAATPQALSLPDGEGSIEGMGESFSASLSTGALSFSVPLAVPAGRAGVTPTLALGYSSGGGSSEVGYGWALGVAAIARQTDRGLPRYVDRPTWHPEEDHFVYAGAHELVPVDSARMTARDGGVVPAELSGWQQYRAQVEGGFMRFFRSPDSTRWVVQAPDGTRHDLGLLPAGEGPSEMVSASQRSLMTDGGSRVASWALTRTSDAHGSSIYYVYDSHEGERYLSDVYYVSPAACAASSAALQRRCSASLVDYGARVHLVYEGRPDPTVSYRTGWRVRSARRLRRIEITAAGASVGGRTLVRRYHFGYDARSYHSLLITLTVEGRPEHAGPMGARVGDASVPEGMLGDGMVGVTLPPMRFRYSGQDALARGVDGFPALDGTRHQGASSPRDGAGDRRADLYDVNSDGLVDLLVTDPARFRGEDGEPAVGVYFNGFTGSGAQPASAGTFSDPIAIPMPAHLADTMSLANPNVVPMDVDGDGRSDLLHMPRVAEYGFFTPVRQSGNQASPAAQGWQFAYIPVELEGELDPRVDLSRDAERIRVLDVNDDGLIDVVRTSGTAIQTWLNLGWYPGGEGRFGSARLEGGEWALSTQPLESCLPVAGSPVSFEDSSTRLADMNGDGLEDIVRLGSGVVAWWPSLGHGRFGAECGPGVVGARPVEMRAPLGLSSAIETTYLSDVDGDGMSDLVRLGTGALEVWFNMGGAGFSRRASVEGLRWARDLDRVVRFVDVDGSGTTDVLFARARQWEWVDPMGGRRPRLLTSVENGLGAVSRFTYASGAEDYLRDLASATSCTGADCDSFLWQGRDDGQCDGRVTQEAGLCLVRSTGTPSVSTVVRATETSDRLSVLGAPEMTTRTEYYYHDGYYEGVEQEHRGFGATDVLSIGGTGQGTSLTRTRMHQARRPRSMASERLAPNPWESLKGRTYLTETFDMSNGRASGATHVGYRTRVIATGLDGREVAWTYAERTDEIRYDTTSWAPMPAGTRAIFYGPGGGDTYPAVTRERVGDSGVAAPDSAQPGWRHAVPWRSRTHAIIASTVDAVDNVGHTTRSTAWGRVRTEWEEPLAWAEDITSVSEPRLVDSERWIWRTAETYVYGHWSTERLGRTTSTFNATGDVIATRGEVRIPRAYAFGGDTDGSESFTQSPEDIVGTIAVDTWGQVATTCAGGTVESPASCLRYSSAVRDPAYAQVVTSETVATGSGAGLTWTARFDRGLGVYVGSTDPRGAMSSYGLDGLGRPTFVSVPPVRGCEGTSVPASVVFYSPTTDPVSVPLSTMETTVYRDCHDTSDVAVARSYVDGLGRVRAALSRTDAPHAWVRGGLTEYTPRGTVYRTYNAAFLDVLDPSPVMVLRPTGSEESAYRIYDAFGRLYVERGMGARWDEATFHFYGALTHTVMDANNMLPAGTHVASGLGTTYRMDGHGRVEDTVLRQRQELGMAIEYYRLWARYRADGSVMSLVRVQTVNASAVGHHYNNPAAVVNGRRVQRTFAYDSQGRRLASTDRDTDARRAGASEADRSWRYLWNRVGDLVAVRDPRGCGQNFYYDRAGRLLGEDYVSCAESEPWRDIGSEMVPAGSIAMGFLGGSRRVDVRAHYDAYPAWVAGELTPPAWAASTEGMLTASSDRGSRSVVAYDTRGVLGWTARQMAMLPQAPLAASSIASALPVVSASTRGVPVTRRFDEAHTYVAEGSFDHAGRARTSTLPTDPDFVGSGSTPMIGGRIDYDTRGLPRSVVATLDGTAMAIIERATYAADGLMLEAVLGDGRAGAREATRTVMGYDHRRRPRSISTTRSPTSTGSTARPLSAVSVVLDQEYAWDRVGNLDLLTDRRPGREWGAGFRPQSVDLDYDGLYHVTRAMFSYSQDDGSRSPLDAASDYRLGIAGVEHVDPMRERPASSVAGGLSTRVVNLNWEYDFLGNMTEWSDDLDAFHERSLSAITNGIDEVDGRPSAIRVASSIDTEAHAYSATAERGGWLEVDYGDSGNVTGVTVHGQCRDASTTALCADSAGTPESRRSALRAGCVCAAEQHYQYRFDELNQIVDARRYDRPGTGSWSLQAHLRYGFDGAQQRTVKEVRDTLGETRYAIWPYPGDFERRGLVRGIDGYEATSATETSYMIGGARIVWQNDGELDGFLDADHRITMPIADLLGTSSAVIDLVTGELLEVSTYQPNGARETLAATEYRNVPLEPYGFTGKEADEEVGLTYFGMRFLMPRLGRWASPDPLQIHAEGGGEVMNNYHYISGNLLQTTDPIGLNYASPRDRADQAELEEAGKHAPIAVIQDSRMSLDQMVDVLHAEYRRRAELDSGGAAEWARSQAYGGVTLHAIVNGRRVVERPGTERPTIRAASGFELSADEVYLGGGGFFVRGTPLEVEMAQMDGSIGGIIYGRWRVAGMSHDEAMAQAGMGRAITGVAPAAGPLASRYQSAVPTLVVRQPARRYIPLQPLAQQRLSNGQSVPAPDPRAIDSDGTVYPHTTLGMQVSEGRFAGSRYHYRQSATFPGGRPNGYGSQLLPWGRTDWSSHPSTSTPHPVPHTHPIRMLRGIFAVPSSGPDHMVRGAGGGAPR